MANSGRIKQLNELLANEPEDVFLNYALGMEYAAQEDNFNLAENQFKKVQLLNPNYIAVYYQLGKLFENQKRNEEALSNYHTGLKLAREQKNNKAINEFSEAIFMLED